MKAELTVSLNAEGALQVALPGPGGGVRHIPLKAGMAAELLQRMLMELAAGVSAIGTDAAPTAAQVRHWERHQVFSDEHCSFCTKRSAISTRKRVFRAVPVGNTGVVVRRVAPGMTAAKAAALGPSVSTKTLAELGL